MTFSYNIDFELASMGFVIILLVYNIIQYPKKTKQNSMFRWVSITMILTELLDIFSAYLISNPDLFPISINVFVSTLYFMTGLTLTYLLLVYTSSYIIPENGKTHFDNIGLGLYVISLATFIANIPGKFYFFFDSNGQYIHGQFYYVVYLVPQIFVLFSGINIILNKTVMSIRKTLSSATYVILIMLGGLLQALFFPDVMLVQFGGSLALLIIFFSLETPNYQLLNKTLVELQESKANMEELYIKANQANQAKSAFLSHMSHEIRTPINAIVGLNEMILRESTEEEIIQYASDSKGATNTLYSIINDILDFSKIESGKLDIVPVPYYFENLIMDVKNLISDSCDRKKLEFIIDIDHDIPSKMLGDETRIRQVLINLLTNAVKYTQNGFVRLHISGKVTTEKVLLHCEVQDTGVGIKSEDLDKLFAPFERLDKIKNRNIEGTGLGLSITKKILENMNSTLKVESEYGKGTTFSFEIEQSILDFSPIGVKNWRAKTTEFKPVDETTIEAPDIRILIVDDNALNRKVIVSLLKHTKMTIDQAGDGEECLELVKNNNYDLIFLDHMMPNMDGVETLEKIKEQKLCTNTPIIALTANAISGMREFYLTTGFDDFLSKPIFSKDLNNTLKRWLPADSFTEVDIVRKAIVKKDSKTNNKQDEAVSTNNCNIIDFPNIDGISWDYGKLFLPDDILLNSALDYYDALLDTRNHIAELYNNISSGDNLILYQTTVHSLKSTSAMIGATQLSALAKLLEHSARDNNINKLKTLHPILIEEIDSLYVRMNCLNSMRENTDSKDIKPICSIKPQLTSLKHALEDFDYDVADKVIKDIGNYTYDDKNEMIEQLKKQITNLQSAAAITTIDEIIG